MDPFADLTSQWPPAARTAFAQLREIAHDAAPSPLAESLKWGQPAWRPIKPRTGATLRAMWHASTPARLHLYVDCKTNLAARMQDLYPQIENDGRRALSVPLDILPQEAVHHLAAMIFRYHLASARAPA